MEHNMTKDQILDAYNEGTIGYEKMQKLMKMHNQTKIVFGTTDEGWDYLNKGGDIRGTSPLTGKISWPIDLDKSTATTTDGTVYSLADLFKKHFDEACINGSGVPEEHWIRDHIPLSSFMFFDYGCLFFKRHRTTGEIWMFAKDDFMWHGIYERANFPFVPWDFPMDHGDAMTKIQDILRGK